MALLGSRRETRPSPRLSHARAAVGDAVTAAAERIDPSNRAQISRLKTRRQQWQEEAWAYFDEIGELKYAVRFLSNAISKVRLYPAYQDEPDHPPIALGRYLEELETGATTEADDAEGHVSIPELVTAVLIEAAKSLIYDLKAPIGGQAEIMRAMAANLFVAGEFYLAEFAAGGSDPDRPEETLTDHRWDVYSVDEIKTQDKMSIVDRPGQVNGRTITANDQIDRMWIRHPRTRQLADSSFRGVLASCQTLLILDRTIRAVAKSRTPAGMLLMPQELSFGPDDETETAGGGEERQDPFEEELDKAMTTPILDESSASSVVPLRVTGPGEFLGDVRVVELGRQLSAELLAARTAELDRIASGLDLPIELLTGMSTANHWGAWLIDQSLFRSHLEPVIVSICDFLTAVVVRPGLIAQGFDPDVVDRVVCWYDATPVITRVNLQDDAKYLHQNMALSDAAARAVMGFDESDAPDEGEILRRMPQHQRTLDPVLLRYMLQLAFPDFQPPPPESSAGTPDVIGPGEQLPPPSEEQRAEGPPPESGRPGAGEEGTGPDNPMSQMRQWLEQGPDAFAALVADSLAARTAGNGHKAEPASTVGARLSSLDRQLMHRLLGAGDAAVRQALTKAGARLRSRPAMRATIPKSANVANDAVAAFLGPETVHAQFSDEQLLQGSFDDYVDQFGTWTAEAQRKALQTLSDDGELDQDETAALDAQLSSSRDRAGEWLLGALVALGAARLYNPAPETRLGESSPNMGVPPGVVRQAMAIAGGAQNVEQTPAGGLTVDSGARPAGGASMGEAVRSALLGAGFEERGWTWQHDDPDRDFEPHVLLDGEDFASWEDDVLVNDEGWPDTDFFFPGDHAGCLCLAVPTLVLSVPGNGDDETPADAVAASSRPSRTGQTKT